MRVFDWYFCAFDFDVICAVTAGPVVNSCEARKKDSHTLFAVGDDGSPITGSSVIVLNAVNDSVCNLQCAVGYYHWPFGNNAAFLCAAKTTDRTSREAIATYPINCTGGSGNCVCVCVVALWIMFGGLTVHLPLSCARLCHMVLHASCICVLCAEQECHLLKDQADDPHHLDQKPGYKIQAIGTASCDDSTKLTFQECEEARAALDWRAATVVNVTNTNLPTGCYRQKNDTYRQEHEVSSYVWNFNEADSGESDSKSAPVCKGEVKRSWLCARACVECMRKRSCYTRACVH